MLAGAAPARELYGGDIFRLACQVAHQPCDQWYVLSAQHDLVAPDAIIMPDTLTMPELRAADRRLWAQGILRNLALHNTQATTWFMLASALYHEYLRRRYRGR